LRPIDPVEASTAPAALAAGGIVVAPEVEPAGGAHDDEAAVEMDENDEIDVGKELASAEGRRGVEAQAGSAEADRR
jgi:hypothetical protein